MARLRLFTLIVYLVTTQCSCAVYLGASVLSAAATSKSPGEHALSTITNHDCGVKNYLDNRYYCEEHRQADKHYVRAFD